MLSQPDLQQWKAVCARHPRRIVALTGAGISAESGIPTFRGAGGLEQQLTVSRRATKEAFAADPRRVWEWYDERRRRAAVAQPNAGHRALVEMERLVARLVVITQNVDGLHQRAGSGRVLELHGSLWRLRCTACGHEEENRVVPLIPLPPVCRACGAPLRPAVVWFGEILPQSVLAAAYRETEAADLLLVVGTSGMVQPAASMPEWAHRTGALVMEINPQVTPLSDNADLSLRGTAGEVLPELVTIMRNHALGAAPNK